GVVISGRTGFTAEEELISRPKPSDRVPHSPDASQTSASSLGTGAALGSVVPRGDRPRHRVAARLRRLGPRDGRATAAERRLVHVVEAQAVVEQHLALGGIGDVLSLD